MSLKGQVALVVGGASGIGLATVRLLLHEGANVILCDVNVDGETIVKELQAEFGVQRCLFALADVRDDAQLKTAFTTTKDQFKRLDIVVQCAGILDDVDWTRSVDVNLNGIIRGTLLAWKHMGKHEGGNGGIVVNIASVAALMSFHASPIYTATKNGVIGFSRSCGEPYHLDRTGVRVISICPGQTDTPILHQVKLMTPGMKEELLKVQAVFPLQTADNVARGVLQVIHNGASGSVWVSEDEKPSYQVILPMYQDMRIKESLSSETETTVF